MDKRLRVALLIESSRGFGRNLLNGIATYARVAGPWTFYHEERSIGDSLPAKIKDWRPDGILARIEHPNLVRQLRSLRVPTVDLFHQRLPPWIPKVISDQQAIMRLAADHLLALGLRNFAYCGWPGIRFSDERRRHLAEYLASHGYSLQVFAPDSRARAGRLAVVEARSEHELPQMIPWLRALPKPVGLVACNDMRAYQVLSIRDEAGIRVPDEVAVIGVNNDRILCELSDLLLSSVDPDARRIGHKAAALLHRMIQGRGPVPKTTLIAPRGVVARQSTDVLAFADPEMVLVVRYLRDHACEGLTVDALVRRMAVSRATLCRWFARHLGYSPGEEIARVKVERVKELLTTTTLRLEEVARRCGFDHAETMYRLFRRTTGNTPGEYRTAHGAAAPALEF